MRDSFVFYNSFYESIEELPAELFKDTVKAICEYAFMDKMPEKGNMAYSLFALVKPQIDANNKRYENGCKGAEYGSLGGRPKKTQENPKKTPKKPLNNPKKTPKKPQENPKQTPNVNDNDNDNENDNDIYVVCSNNIQGTNHTHISEETYTQLVSIYGQAFVDERVQRAYDDKALISFCEADYGRVKAKNKNSFNGYANQRQYDFDELERNLRSEAKFTGNNGAG